MSAVRQHSLAFVTVILNPNRHVGLLFWCPPLFIFKTPNYVWTLDASRWVAVIWIKSDNSIFEHSQQCGTCHWCKPFNVSHCQNYIQTKSSKLWTFKTCSSPQNLHRFPAPVLTEISGVFFQGRHPLRWIPSRSTTWPRTPSRCPGPTRHRPPGAS